MLSIIRRCRKIIKIPFSSESDHSQFQREDLITPGKEKLFSIQKLFHLRNWLRMDLLGILLVVVFSWTFHIASTKGKILDINLCRKETGELIAVDMGRLDTLTLRLTLTPPCINGDDNGNKSIKLVVVPPRKSESIVAFVKYAHLKVNWSTIMDEDNELDFVPQCLEYIQFESPDGIERVCHNVEKNDTRLHPHQLIGPRIMRNLPNSEGKKGLQLIIHAQMTHVHVNNSDHRTLAILTITAYKGCSKFTKNRGTFHQHRCSKTEQSSCISSRLLCDGEINCLFDGEFGTDEKNCSLIRRKEGELGEDNVVSLDDNNDEQWNVEVIEEEKKGQYEQMKQYVVPTAAFFFLIWGIITLFKKCYKCYRQEYGKEDHFYYNY